MRRLLLAYAIAMSALGQSLVLKATAVDNGGCLLSSTTYMAGVSVSQPVASGVLGAASYQAIIGFWRPPHSPSVAVVEGAGPQVFPAQFRLDGGYPNPFDRLLSVRYQVPIECRVRLRILDAGGRSVAILKDLVHQPGRYTTTWSASGGSGRSLPGGVYFCRLDAGAFSATTKVVKLR
jgi:hypothetical protein